MRIWKENWLSFIRYGMLMLLVVFIVALLGADKTSETKIETVEKAVEKEVPLTGMHSVQSQMVKRLYGLNVNDYEGVVLYISDSNMGAEELLIVKLADTSQAEAVESAVQTRIENQENSFEGYGVEDVYKRQVRRKIMGKEFLLFLLMLQLLIILHLLFRQMK